MRMVQTNINLLRFLFSTRQMRRFERKGKREREREREFKRERDQRIELNEKKNRWLIRVKSEKRECVDR